MNLIEKASLRICKEVLEKSPSAEKTVLNYCATFLGHEEEVIEFQIVTKENEYKFILDLIRSDDDENDVLYEQLHYKINERTLVEIRDISIKGYEAVKFEPGDVCNLTLILQTLASDHSRDIEERYLNNSSSDSVSTREFELEYDHDLRDVKDILLVIQTCELKNVGKIDPVKLIGEIEKLVSSMKALEHKEDYLYVKGSITQKKLFTKNIKNQPKEYIILNTKPENPTPLVYDVLLTIFYFTDQKLRQHHFHELLTYYYDMLKRNLSNSCSLPKVLPLKLYERHIHKFIPRVKLEMLKQRCQTFLKYCTINKNVDVTKHLMWESITEINECILYPRLNREDCYEIVNNKLGSSEYTFLNYELIQLEERKGFLGDYFKLKINILHHDEHKSLDLFAKYLPDCIGFAKDLAVDSFEKEEFYYRVFMSEISRVGLEDISDFLPKCYFSRPNDVLVLEDMSVINYISLDINVLFTYDLLHIVVKQIAKVHACSILYEEIMTKATGEVVTLGSKYEKFVEEMVFQKKNQVQKYIGCGLDTILKMIELLPEVARTIPVEEFKRRAKLTFDLAFGKVKTSGRFRNVICQGDCWSSNILFQMDENNRPVDCRILDYQLIRYCPPGHDLFFLFYATTNREVRKKYMAKLIDDYYFELSGILKKYGFDLNTIYTYDHFLDSCNYMKSQGLCHAALILQLLLYPREKMDVILEDAETAARLYYVDRKEFLEELECNEIYGQRMRELIEELYDICETACL